MVRLLLYVLIGFAALVVAGYFTVAAPIADARYNTVQAEPPYDPSGRAQALHDTLMVADLHNDLLLWGRDPLTRHDRGTSGCPRSWRVSGARRHRSRPLWRSASIRASRRACVRPEGSQGGSAWTGL